jgi:lipoprotein NlpD
MALSRPNRIFFWITSILLLTHCSDFRAIFDGKPQTSVAKKQKKSKSSTPRIASNPEKGLFVWPIHGKVESTYGKRHGRPHDGVDIKADKGEKFVAAANGEVIFSDRLGGYGKLIVIKHSEKYFTAYAHNKENLVDKGDQVKQGQVIGKIGNTGNASGSHLHFEIRDSRGPQDPMGYLPETKYSSR